MKAADGAIYRQLKKTAALREIWRVTARLFSQNSRSVARA